MGDRVYRDCHIARCFTFLFPDRIYACQRIIDEVVVQHYRLVLWGVVVGVGLFALDMVRRGLPTVENTWFEELMRFGFLLLPVIFGFYAQNLARHHQRPEHKDRNEDVSQRLASAVFDSTDQAVIITDKEHHIVCVNPAFLTITGYTRQEVQGKTPLHLTSARHNKAFYDNIWRSLEEKGNWQGEIWNCRKNGESFSSWNTISPVYNADTGIVTHYVFVFSDITPIKRQEMNVGFLAYHDPLTFLPNRLMFGDRLEHALSLRSRLKTPVALLFIDLDGFKDINDTLGHAAGDRLLQEVANRLQSVLRGGDTVARFGGDEFVVLAESCESHEGIKRIAEKIIEKISQPVQVNEHEVVVQASIGIAVSPADGIDGKALVQAADQAMYHAKKYEGSHFCFYAEG
jgi:diguanylate cyclase (GGDEF)-like protein/PAS domain S-box-containing protein